MDSDLPDDMDDGPIHHRRNKNLLPMTTTNCCEKCRATFCEAAFSRPCPCTCHTPNPLTAAMEELLEKFEVLSGDGQIRPLLRQAFALGKQEGMEEGAASAVEYIEASLPTLPDGATSVRLKITRPNLSKVLEAARTAHKEQGHA